MIERIFPKVASNDYRGNPLAIYGLCFLSAVFAFRSFVHFLTEDAGINTIASIITFPGSPDPDRVIHLFASLWGGQQVITLLILVVVLVRYRNLIPLMAILLMLEQITRIVAGLQHPLDPTFYEHEPPGGARGTLMFFGVSLLILVLSLRHRAQSPPDSPEA
ncbi:MAG: hypothetical protein ACPG1C_12550 [Alphaproteobacteria bacterium]